MLTTLISTKRSQFDVLIKNPIFRWPRKQKGWFSISLLLILEDFMDLSWILWIGYGLVCYNKEKGGTFVCWSWKGSELGDEWRRELNFGLSFDFIHIKWKWRASWLLHNSIFGKIECPKGQLPCKIEFF